MSGCFPIILFFCFAGYLSAEPSASTGEAIYGQHCASCHGKNGEGVDEEYDEPLRGERSLASLARYIDRNMPEDNPHLLNGDESLQVAQYIIGAFYSNAAQAARPLPKKAFARLTNRQFRESVADLFGSFLNPLPPGYPTGLRAQYFQSKGMNKKESLILDRKDAVLSFDFADRPPVDGINADQFCIAWSGSLLAPATGWYEFKISTPNGARLYLNGEAQQDEGNKRDDNDSKRQPVLIDAWVSTGDTVRELTARVFLLGGRAYPLRFDYFKYQEKNGMVRLEWKAPHGSWEVLAAPYLSPATASHVTCVSTDFPADDASEGFERGSGVSKAWHEAVSAAAVDVANQVLVRLPLLSGVSVNDPDRVPRLKSFLQTLAERAFRRPLDESMKQLYIDRHFESDVTPEQAVKRAVILLLESPRFLYPEMGKTKDHFTVATRLALGMWDSLPDVALLDAAKAGKLRDSEQIRGQGLRMAADPRAKAKLNSFFQRWLKLDSEADLQKDPAEFPGFDAPVVADLRRSLELFVELVVWSEKSDYCKLLQADYLLFNERLANYYKIPWLGGDGFQPVKCDSTVRSGVLTHPYLLARLAHADNTSPIHRGVFITRNLLGGILKAPPEAIVFDKHRFSPKMTMREKVVELTRNNNCMSCHDTINPLGFSLENFDAVGRYRTMEADKPINAESEYYTIEGDLLQLHGPRDVARHAVESVSARKGFIRQMFQSLVKQSPAVYGLDTLDKLDQSFTSSGFNIHRLFIEINTLTAAQGMQASTP
jgi:hypothetical protein